ncbi:MAG: hypothetical protein FD118_1891 [Rhodocyclaceae bacterium]|nr:MAG: hypothetical protein FD118_1891 [Rhodocyclaceae bacterium]
MVRPPDCRTCSRRAMQDWHSLRPGLLGGIEDIPVRSRGQFDDRQLRLKQQPQAQGLWIYGQFAWRRNGHLAVGNAKRRYPPRRPLPTDPQTPKSKILFLFGVQGQKLLAQNQTRMATCVPRQGYPELRVGFRPAFPGQTTAPDQLANVLDPPRRNARSQRPHRPRVAPRFHPSPPR